MQKFILPFLLTLLAGCSDDAEQSGNNSNSEAMPTATQFVLQNASDQPVYIGTFLIKVGTAERDFFSWNYPCEPDLCGECLPGEPPMLEELAAGAERRATWAGYIYGERTDGCVPRTTAEAGFYTVEWCYSLSDDEATASECVSQSFELGETVTLVTNSPR